MNYDNVSYHDEVVGFIPVVRRRRIQPYPNEVRYDEPVGPYIIPLP